MRIAFGVAKNIEKQGTSMEVDLIAKVVRVLHQYQRGHGFEFRLSLIFFFRLHFYSYLSCV